MRGLEADGEAERLAVLRRTTQETQGLLAHEMIEVRAIFALRKVVTLSREAVEGIKVGARQTLREPSDRDSELADESGAVARLLEHHGIAPQPVLGGEMAIVKVAAVAALDPAGEVTRAAGHADRAGDKEAREAHPALRQGVEMRRLDDRVAKAAEIISAQVVGEQEEEIGARLAGQGIGLQTSKHK